MSKIQKVKPPTTICGCKVVQDVTEVIQKLTDGEVVYRYEFGDSMLPILSSGEYCRLTPIRNGEEAEIGDAVFCCVNGCWMTHLVWNKSNSASKENGTFYLIGSTWGEYYGWTNQVLAIAQGTNIIEEENNHKYFQD